MKRSLPVVPLVLLGTVLAGFGVYICLPRVPTVILLSEEGGVKARIPCADGLFTYRYVHSIHRTDVDEEYRIEPKGTLLLTASRFDTLGVGIPYDEEGGFSVEGHRFVLKMNRRYRSLPIRTSPVPGQLIIVGGREYPFTNWFAPGDLVIVEARHLPGPRFFSRVRPERIPGTSKN